MSESQASENFIDACGVRLRAVVDVDSSGRSAGLADGSSVLVLHGFTGSAESMESVSESLRARHTVIRLELIGHGGSESPTRVEPYSMDACAAQVAEVVRQLGIAPPHLLGYSMGGRTAIAAALADPECYSSLILVGATAGIADSKMRRDRIAADRALADRIETRPLAEFVDEWMALPIFASQASLGSEALERARAQRLSSVPIGLANSLRGMGAGAQRPLFDQLEKIVVPVLLVAGEKDAKFREIAASLQSSIPNARTEIVSGVGHAAHLEAPVEFGRLVTSFLAESAATRARSPADAQPVAPLPRLDRV